MVHTCTYVLMHTLISQHDAVPHYHTLGRTLNGIVYQLLFCGHKGQQSKYTHGERTRGGGYNSHRSEGKGYYITCSCTLSISMLFILEWLLMDDVVFTYM